MFKYFKFLLPLFILIGCSEETDAVSEDDAKQFLLDIQKSAETEGPINYSAAWISSNFITYDSQVVMADFSKRSILKGLEQARIASTFDNLKLEKEDRRALNIIKNGFVMPPPLNEKLAGELSGISTELEAMYGAGEHCFPEGECYRLGDFEAIIDNSRDPDELLRAWDGWREIGKPMKEKYLRMVDIGNQGALLKNYI